MPAPARKKMLYGFV